MSGRLHASQHLHPLARRRPPSRAYALATGDSDWYVFLQAVESPLAAAIFTNPPCRWYISPWASCGWRPRTSSTTACRAEKPGDCTRSSPTGSFPDIETTGLSPDYSEVTVIGGVGGGKLALFVKGINLDQFPAYVSVSSRSGVTFNGSLFDVPFPADAFPGGSIGPDQYRPTVCAALARIPGRAEGHREESGGLPRCSDPGCGRIEAVGLWHCYRRGDREALRNLSSTT